MANTANLLLPSKSLDRNARGLKDRKIQLGSLADKIVVDISSFITRASISYDISLASELSFEVVDVDMTMSKNNYFILGRDVIYETTTLGQINSYTGETRPVVQLFEIADVSVSQGPGGNVIYAVKCYTKAIQQMKRDKKPGAIQGNGSTFVRNAAYKYGLRFYGQETSKSKKITKAGGSKQAQSVWDVLDNLATDAKFVLFEVDGILIFASEKFLMNKWGTDFLLETKTKIDPKTKKKKTKKTARRFIPLQFPNAGPEYVGTPGYFLLTEHPTIKKSANDPYAADGSCTVERSNGVQIRPGMTAYVGTIPNMSGYYLIDAVSYDEMSPDPVSLTFRTLTRDEEKEKIKMLPLGQTYQNSYILDSSGAGIQNSLVTTKEFAQQIKGKPLNSPLVDKRIVRPNQATNENRYIYPIMPFANISRTYGDFIEPVDNQTASKDQKSTNDANSLLITGNIDLWERPVLPIENSSGRITGYHTIFSTTHVVQAGAEYRAILLPLIYTENGEPVEKTEEEAIDRYENDGGYLGSAKHLGVLSGSTKQRAILNARDYALLLSFQQRIIMTKRFNKEFFANITPVAGSADSNW